MGDPPGKDGLPRGTVRAKKRLFRFFFTPSICRTAATNPSYGSARMKVLVTGGAGYIGSVTVERLIAAGYAVVVLDNLSQGHAAAVHPEATLVEGDLRDAEAIEALFATHSIEAVMHFASHTLVGESMQKPFCISATTSCVDATCSNVCSATTSSGLSFRRLPICLIILKKSPSRKPK